MPPNASRALLLELSSEACGHLAVAINRYRHNAVLQGVRVPSELKGLEDAVAARAMRGQNGSPLGPDSDAQNAGPVHGKLATYSQAAALLNCSLSTIKRRVATGALTAVRDGGLTRIRITDLDAYIDQLGDQAC